MGVWEGRLILAACLVKRSVTIIPLPTASPGLATVFQSNPSFSSLRGILHLGLRNDFIAK